MDTKTLATMLLVGRIITVVVILLVIYRQIKIARSRPDPSLRAGRVVLMSMSIVALLSNVVPVLIDIGVILGEIPRAKPTYYGIAYGLSSNLSTMFLSFGVLALYIIAEKLLKKTLVENINKEKK